MRSMLAALVAIFAVLVAATPAFGQEGDPLGGLFPGVEIDPGSVTDGVQDEEIRRLKERLGLASGDRAEIRKDLEARFGTCTDIPTDSIGEWVYGQLTGYRPEIVIPRDDKGKIMVDALFERVERHFGCKLGAEDKKAILRALRDYAQDNRLRSVLSILTDFGQEVRTQIERLDAEMETVRVEVERGFTERDAAFAAQAVPYVAVGVGGTIHGHPAMDSFGLGTGSLFGDLNVAAGFTAPDIRSAFTARFGRGGTNAAGWALGAEVGFTTGPVAIGPYGEFVNVRHGQTDTRPGHFGELGAGAFGGQITVPFTFGGRTALELVAGGGLMTGQQGTAADAHLPGQDTGLARSERFVTGQGRLALRFAFGSNPEVTPFEMWRPEPEPEPEPATE